MKKYFLILSICLFFSFGDLAAAGQNAASRDEVNAVEKEIRELQTRMAEMTTLLRENETAPLTAPTDAAAGPCYDGAYHNYHDYRCYQIYRKHYNHH